MKNKKVILIFILLGILGLLLFSLLTIFYKHIPVLGQAIYAFQRDTPLSPIKNEYDGKMKTVLFDCRSDDVNQIVGLVEKGANPNFIPEGGNTPLICLARSGRLYDAEKIIQLGAKVNQKNRFIDDSPLLSATDCLRFDIVKLLLEKGADPNITDNTGETALMKLNSRGPNAEQFYDIQIKIAKLLIENGANVNHVCHAINCISSSEGSTPLLEASRYNNSEFIKFLLEKGANVNAQDKMGWSPLLVAIKSGNYDVAQVLIEHGADVFVEDKLSQNQNLLDMVASGWNWNQKQISDEDQVKLCNLLIDKGINADITDQNGFTPLMQAVNYGNAKLVETLIKKGANVKAKIKGYSTPLMFLGMTEAQYDKNRPSVEENERIIKLLINNGADINAVNNKGESALYIAIENNQIEAAKALIKNGADINLEMPDGTTILTKAIEKKQDELVNLLISQGAKTKKNSAICSNELINLAKSNEIEISQKLIELIKNGANHNCVDKEGNNLLSYAVQEKNYNLTDYLIKKGVDVNHKNKKGQTPLMFANDLAQTDLLIRNKATIDIKDKSGKHLLMYLKDPIQVELIVKSGINVDTKDKTGQTLLMHSVLDNNLNLTKKLLELGADINAKDIMGKTVLMNAGFENDRFSGNSCIIYKFLMDKGADINAKDNEGKSANYWAKKNDCDLIEIQKSPELYTLRESEEQDPRGPVFDVENLNKIKKGIDTNTEVHYLCLHHPQASKEINETNINVTIKNKPVVLFISNWATYSLPLIYNIKLEKGVNLKKVIIDENKKINFINNNKNITISELSRGNYIDPSVSSIDDFIESKRRVEELTGKKPSSINGIYTGKKVIIDGKTDIIYPELETKNIRLIGTNGYTTVYPDYKCKKEAIASEAYGKGKWYFEASPYFDVSEYNENVGIYCGASMDSKCKYEALKTDYSSANKKKCKVGDVIGVALDLANHKVYFSKNGMWLNGLPNQQIGGESIYKEGVYRAYANGYFEMNFGTSPFKHKPPTGFKAYNDGKQ